MMKCVCAGWEKLDASTGGIVGCCLRVSVTGEPDWGVFGSPLRDGKTWSASVCSIAVMQLLGLGTGEPFLRVLGAPAMGGGMLDASMGGIVEVLHPGGRSR